MAPDPLDNIATEAGRLIGRNARTVRIVITIVVLLVVWHAVSVLFLTPDALPSPVLVYERLLEILNVGGPRGNSAIHHLWISVKRVLIILTVIMAVAIMVGIVMANNRAVERLVSMYLPIWMIFPGLVVVLIAMIIFRFDPIAVYVSTIFLVTPHTVVTIWESARDTDEALLEMGASLNADKWQMFRHIYLPSVLPAIFGSLRYSLSLVWKVVALTEVFGINNGLGAVFRFWFSQGDILTMLAYLSLFLFVMFAIEYGLIYPVEQYLFRWRN